MDGERASVSTKQWDDESNKTQSLADLRSKTVSRKMQQEQDLADLLKKATEKSERVTPTQAFAMTALAALPMIVSRSLSGRTPGATALDAAKMSAKGVEGAIQGLKEDNLSDNRLAVELAKQNMADLEVSREKIGQLDLLGAKDELETQREATQHQYRMKEMAQRQAYDNPLSSNPLAQSWLAKRSRGENTTPEEDLAASKDLRVYQTGNLAGYREGIESRAEDDKKTKMAQLEVYGFKPKSPGLILSPQKAERANKLIEGETDFQIAARELKKAILAGDKEAIKSAYTGMSIAQAAKANTGAALSVNEEFRKLGNLPELVENGRFTAVALQRALGIDPIRLIDAAANFSAKATEESMDRAFGHTGKIEIFTAENEANRGGPSREERLQQLKAQKLAELKAKRKG